MPFVPFVNRLALFLRNGDPDGARELLSSLKGEELREAKDWFANRRQVLTFVSEIDFGGGTSEAARSRPSWEANWIIGICAVALCGPATAARRTPWSVLWDFMQCAGEATFVHMLCDKEPGWVAEFAEAASHVSLGGNARNSNQNLSRVVRAALVHHGLPCPRGRTFLKEWLAGGGAGTHVERLSRDPLMPDLLFHYLASGHCGQDPWLPEAVVELVAAGRVDRTSLLEHVLSLLTAPQRPSSQRVLVGILASLRPAADEIPGGLTYLLGAIATGEGTVGLVLLPHALALVADAPDLLELTIVVTSRPERKQRQMLLTGFQDEALQHRVGTQGVRAALEVLAVSDDASFAAKVAKVAAGMGAVGAAGPQPAASGLWDLDPIPTGVIPPDWWSFHVAGTVPWDQFLDSRLKSRDFERGWFADQLLRDLAQDSYVQMRALAEAVDGLLVAGRLAVGRLAAVLADTFLGGGMRQTWVVALALADSCCGAPRKPGGLHDLLRTLASFAHDVPTQELPPKVLALAVGDGGTKAQMEARALGAALAGIDVDEFLHGARAIPIPASRARPVRGLWTQVGPRDRLPSEIRLEELASDPLALRRTLEADFNYYSQGFGDVCFWPTGFGEVKGSTNLTHPELVLGATVRAIHVHGAHAVRGALSGIERKYEPLDVVSAIDLWIADRIDLDSYWRIVSNSVTHHEVTSAWWEDSTRDREEVRGQVNALPGLVEGLVASGKTPLVLPRALDSAAARLAFLRACEALLRASETPIMLSTPTYADGTLDFDDLLARLKAAYGAPVGPLDLVQALHRLRTADVGRVAELDLGPMPTSAELTQPDGTSTWDAVELVRAWVGSGGLPPLEAVAVDGAWITSTKAPVPWSRCAAIPTELRGDPWSPGSMIETVRVFPLWGDRTIKQAHPTWRYFAPGDFPGRVSGPWGLPLHDRLLALLTPTAKDNELAVLDTIRDVAAHDRLDPDRAAAAALGRHGAGSLSLSRLTQGLATAFEGGSFRGLWPSALAIANALCGVPNKPSGLPGLLRLLTAYSHEVPERQAPPILRAFAEGAGSSKSNLEARALVAALDLP